MKETSTEYGAPFREPSAGERRYGPFSEIRSGAAHPKDSEGFRRLRRVRPLKRLSLSNKLAKACFVKNRQIEVVTRIFRPLRICRGLLFLSRKGI